jgi:hypothetical protein
VQRTWGLGPYNTSLKAIAANLQILDVVVNATAINTLKGFSSSERNISAIILQEVLQEIMLLDSNSFP